MKKNTKNQKKTTTKTTTSGKKSVTVKGGKGNNPKEVVEKETFDPIVTSFADNIKVEIDREVYEKIMHWIDKAPGEVSGLGKVELQDGVFMVTSAILLEQENTSVTTDIDGAAVAKAMYELKDEPGKLNWWWHSHVNMDVFWSGTDVETIHELGKHGWFTATVLNKRRDMKSAYYQKGNGFFPEVFVEHVNTSIIYMAEDDKFAEWDAEYEKKVKEKKSEFPKYSGNRRFNYNEYLWEEEKDNDGYKIPTLDKPGFYDASIFGERNRTDGFVPDNGGFGDGPYDDMWDDDEDEYDESDINELIAAEIERQEQEEKRSFVTKSQKTVKSKRGGKSGSKRTSNTTS